MRISENDNADISIRYTFRFQGREPEVFNLLLDGRKLTLQNRPQQELPDWVALGFEQCPHCPLNPAEIPCCPVAVNLMDTVHRFEGVKSYDRLLLEVISRERTITQETSAQGGISSLVGLLCSTSGCPHTDFFKPMARFHLPLASGSETLFRAAGMYVLAQYFRHQGGLEAELELGGLVTIYRNMHTLNVKIAKRLQSATRTDSSVNAIVLLDVFTHVLPYEIEEQMGQIRHLFDSYLEGMVNLVK
ncbi:MAG: hypothetical protein HGA96_05120 [Desulfobulbaceae bacterium]|nr:hypothetical protein [Desulfobulbaceae bacterium]